MTKHCCSRMDTVTTLDCEKHDKYTCPDVLILYDEVFDEYGISVKDGGGSMSLIHFCPYCGVKLPESKRDLWFDTLEEMGFDDPADQDIPEQFNSSAWYRERNL